MEGGRTALAAVTAAGLWAVTQVPTPAEASPGTSDERLGLVLVQSGPSGNAPVPAEGEPPKAAPKSGEDGAQAQQKQGEEAAPKPRLISILGRETTNREGDGGRVIDVLVDFDGRPSAVVVEFGGFMGIGSRKVVVDWSAVRLVREGNRTAVVIDITREQIRDAAEYKPGEPVSVLGVK